MKSLPIGVEFKFNDDAIAWTLKEKERQLVTIDEKSFPNRSDLSNNLVGEDRTRDENMIVSVALEINSPLGCVTMEHDRDHVEGRFMTNLGENQQIVLANLEFGSSNIFKKMEKTGIR